MKKIISALIISGVFCANAFAYKETETYTVYETLTIDKVSYQKPNKTVHKPNKCRFASSIDVRNNCGCTKPLKPIKVKKYTEVIDHYQVYQPVIKYEPAGTYTTVRIIK